MIMMGNNCLKLQPGRPPTLTCSSRISSVIIAFEWIYASVRAYRLAFLCKRRSTHQGPWFRIRLESLSRPFRHWKSMRSVQAVLLSLQTSYQPSLLLFPETVEQDLGESTLLSLVALTLSASKVAEKEATNSTPICNHSRVHVQPENYTECLNRKVHLRSSC